MPSDEPQCSIPDATLAIAVEFADAQATRVFVIPDDGTPPTPERAQLLSVALPVDVIGLAMNSSGRLLGLTADKVHGPLDDASAPGVELASLCGTCVEFTHGPIADGEDWIAVAADSDGARVLWFSTGGVLGASRLLEQAQGVVRGLSADELGRALVSLDDARILALGKDNSRTELYSGLIEGGPTLFPENFDYHAEWGYVLSGLGYHEPLVWLAGPDPSDWRIDNIHGIGGHFSKSPVTRFVGGSAWILYGHELRAFEPQTGAEVLVFDLTTLVGDDSNPRVRDVAAARVHCE